MLILGITIKGLNRFACMAESQQNLHHYLHFLNKICMKKFPRTYFVRATLVRGVVGAPFL